MRDFPRLLLWLAWCAVSAMACVSAQAAGTADATPVGPPANAHEIHQSSQDFAAYPLIVKRVAQLGGIKGNIAATLTVEGRLTRATYRVGGQQSVAAISQRYAKQLADAGFKTLFQCKADQCGPTFVRSSPGFRVDSGLFDADLSAQHYLAARKPGDSGATYIAVQSAALSGGGVALQIDRLKVKPREVGAISVNAEQMARQIKRSGRAVLYGIYFGFNSAGIKPASRSTLEQIAQLLKNEPRLRLLVVGHTDSRGSFDYNIDLSTRRAKAVVNALVSDYGVARDRLKPWGVGYSAPRASNASDAGRAKNRRVELVPW